MHGSEGVRIEVGKAVVVDGLFALQTILQTTKPFQSRRSTSAYAFLECMLDCNMVRCGDGGVVKHREVSHVQRYAAAVAAE